MDTDKAIQDGIKQAVSHAILSAVDGPQRDAILATAVKGCLGGWEFNAAVKAIVHERVKVLAVELMATGRWDEEIRAALATSFADTIAAVRPALRETLIEALFGKATGDRYTSHAGLILQHMKVKDGG